LTFVVIGGGLVGVELFGELTAFADEIARYYPGVDRGKVRFFLFERGPRILPEIEEELAAYAAEVLAGRRGASLRPGAVVRAIEPGRVTPGGRDHRSRHHRALGRDRRQIPSSPTWSSRRTGGAT
jgi:NADH dehydrogenase